MKKAGIYQIKNTVSQKVYIGLSKNIEGRFVKHLQRLRKNTHRNKHLQSAFNKYGEDCFEFEILEECDEDSLSEKEKQWISETKSCNNKYGYNKTFGGEFGKLHPDIYKRYSEMYKGRPISEEQKRQISKTLTGRKQPRQDVENRAKSIRKLDDKTEQEIVDLSEYGFSYKVISEMYGVKETLPRSIMIRYRRKTEMKNG